MQRFIIRPMRLSDIPRLAEIDPTFTSNTTLRVQRTGSGLEAGWKLLEVPLSKPYDKGSGYDFDRTERRNIQSRLEQSDSLEEVVIDRTTECIVGVLDITIESWRNVAWVWNLMLDKNVRGLGIGRQLVAHSIEWARYRKLRAVMLETQTNNVPACKFYERMGFRLVGINDAYYTNADYERDEIAVFWSYPL
jgi:GNAT superfamily N-acetyltransferase